MDKPRPADWLIVGAALTFLIIILPAVVGVITGGAL